MKYFIVLAALSLCIFSCEAPFDPPPDSFQIRFNNIAGGDGQQFAIGTSLGDLVSESGILNAFQISGYKFVTAGTYNLYRDLGGGWQLYSANLPGGGNGSSFSFATGIKYEFGTNGGVFTYLSVQ